MTAKSGFDMIRSDMRKGFGQSSFESTVGVAGGLEGDNLQLTPPPSLISLTYHNTTHKESQP